MRGALGIVAAVQPPRPPFEPAAPVHTENVGITEVVIFGALALLLLSGLAFFFTKLLGKKMAIGLVVSLGVAAVLAIVHPLLGAVALVLGIPLAVGIVRGLGGNSR